MNEVQYERDQELAEMGKAMTDCLRAILQDNDAETLADLQRSAYKHTEAGVSVSFMLVDGSFLYCGDELASDPGMVGSVVNVGVSCIVEGSDAEVPVRWLDLSEPESPEAAVAAFDALVAGVNDAACALLDEVHVDEEKEV